jgi:putative FmdB family regulatory protein
MPIYEYTCLQCGHPFEQLVRKGDVPACPSCNSENLERMLSLCQVSSENTRSLNIRGARARAREAKREQEHEHHKKLHSHDD